jgi:hypothetical protein
MLKKIGADPRTIIEKAKRGQKASLSRAAA